MYTCLSNYRKTQFCIFSVYHKILGTADDQDFQRIHHFISISTIVSEEYDVSKHTKYIAVGINTSL